MVCHQCKSILLEGAAFCHVCGARQGVEPAGTEPAQEFCTIKFVELESKWSLFGKDICEFQAVRSDGGVVLTSEKMTLSGFECNGPKEKNKKHKRAFDKLVAALLQQGWRQATDEPPAWYAVSFWR